MYVVRAGRRVPAGAGLYETRLGMLRTAPPPQRSAPLSLLLLCPAAFCLKASSCAPSSSFVRSRFLLFHPSSFCPYPVRFFVHPPLFHCSDFPFFFHFFSVFSRVRRGCFFFSVPERFSSPRYCLDTRYLSSISVSYVSPFPSHLNFFILFYIGFSDFHHSLLRAHHFSVSSHVIPRLTNYFAPTPRL